VFLEEKEKVMRGIPGIQAYIFVATTSGMDENVYNSLSNLGEYLGSIPDLLDTHFINISSIYFFL
jgi:hypothetical protein